MNQSFSTSMILNNDIKIRNLSKSYGLCFKNHVLDGLSFDISEREAFGLVGPNGSGKSTTFNILTAELAKSSGHLFLDGNLGLSLFSSKQTLFWKQNLGICFQNNFLYDDMTLEQHIDFYANLNGFRYYVSEFADEFQFGVSSRSISSRWSSEFQTSDRILEQNIEMEEMKNQQNQMETIKETKSEFDEIKSFEKIETTQHGSELDQSSADLLGKKCTQLSLSEKKFESFKDHPKKRKKIKRNPYIEQIEEALDIKRFRSTKAKNLSSGNQRKLCVLISLLKDVKTCLWDEATCGLDVLARYNIRQLLFVLKREKQAKMLITTHFLNDIDLYCDKIGILKNKKFGFLGSTEMLKNEYGGYCIVARGRGQGLKRFLDRMKEMSTFRILEHKQLSNTNAENEAENPASQTDTNQRRRSMETESFGVRNRGGIGSEPIRRESMDVRLSNTTSQSVVKLHVEKFGTATGLFKELQGNVARGNISEFFMNQYNVEHIYVDLMKRLESESN